VTANRNCVIGSIGTRAQLIDTSEKLKKDGIKVIPVAAGKYKAAGMDGTKITAEQVKEFQRQIDTMNEQFIADVVKGRPKLTPAKVRDMEARCFIGKEAIANGLIDGVCSFESTLSHLQQTKTSFGIAGIPGVVTTHAAPNERKIHMELLTQLRELFGAAEMSEEQVVAKVRTLKSDASASAANAVTSKAEIDRLTKENAELIGFKPKAVDLEALKDRADLYADKIEVAVAKQEFTPVMAGKIKALILKDGKPDTFWLSRVESIDARPIDKIVGLFAGEKLGGPATGSQTGTQVLERSVPGGQPSASDLARAEGAKQAKEYQESMQAARGLK
jgi:ClpP class serine protease